MRKNSYLYEESDVFKFNNLINKTILLSSKKYYGKELKNKEYELKILDDDNYEKYLEEKTKYEENFIDYSEPKDAFGFIDFCENLELNIALKSLSAIEQEVIFLLYSKDLSQTEAADILKICSKSVSRIKLRALDKIRNYMKGKK